MEVARSESYLRVGLTEFGDQMDVWVRKKEEVKNDPIFLDWTSKTVLPFSEIGTRGRRKRIYSILDLSCFTYLYGEMFSRWLESDLETRETDLD